MNWSRVYIDAIGYELPPQVVTSAELEERLGPLFARLRFPPGQLEALTGVAERRWWAPGQGIYRNVLSPVRSSSTRSFGCSQAAKCPPRSSWL